jgi:hypothetical protein
MSKHHRFRAQPAERLVQDFRIDRAAGVIRDVCAMQAGIEALGHGCQADLKTLHMMANLANQRGGLGIKQHFGHIGMSENAMGKQIAIARNFRVDGDKLRHDMHMLEPARDSPVFARDPIDFLFNMAEQHPADFGESVVIEVDFVWTLPDGREVSEYGPARDPLEDPDGIMRDDDGRPVDALTPLPIMRPTKFYYCDVVVDGALTHDGLFGAAPVLAEMFSGTSSAYLLQAFEFLDEFREDYGIPLSDVPRKADQFLTAYLSARGQTEDKDMTVKTRTNRKQFDVAPGQPANPPAEDTQATPAPEPTPPVEDELDAALEQADDIAEQADEPTPEEDDEGGEDAGPANTELSARVEKLEGVVGKLVQLAVKQNGIIARQAEALRALDRNVRRIDGEPIAKANVPMNRPSSLESLDGLLDGGVQQFGSRPVPPSAARNSRPVPPASPEGTPSADFDANPELATLEIMTGYAKAIHGK